MPESLREKVAAAMYVRRWGKEPDPEPPPMYYTLADAAVRAVRENLPFPANGDGLNEYRDALCEWLS